MPPLWDVLPGGKWLHSVASPCTFPGPHVLASPGACCLSPGGTHCLTQTLLPNATSRVSGLAHPNTWGSSEVWNVDSWRPARRSCQLTGADGPSNVTAAMFTKALSELEREWRCQSPRHPEEACTKSLSAVTWIKGSVEASEPWRWALSTHSSTPATAILLLANGSGGGQVGFSLAAMAGKGRGGRRSRDKSPVYEFPGKALTCCYSAVRVWSTWCVKCT